MTDDLLFLAVTEQAKLLKSRKTSSVELTQAYLSALETRGKPLRAVAEISAELAMEQARQADKEIASGRYRGVLHGIPYGAKDLLATRGIPTRWGSPAHKEQVFEEDATVIQRLRQAGAVLVAKLAMIELAGAGGYEYAQASLTGACLNPWNPQRWAGGSSSGSGAAVSAGAVGFALGTETWGSITVPSAFENLIRSGRVNELADQSQVVGLLSGLAIPAVDYLRAMRVRAEAKRAVASVFETCDVLMAPTLLQGAPPVDRSLNETWTNMGGNGGFANLTGLPSISVPMGFTGDGLPLGLEIIGAPYEEAKILALAQIFQQETDWHRRRPPTP